jgi:nitroreductase
MRYERPITEIIKGRFSCRTYSPAPIEPDKRRQLQDFLSECRTGPLGTTARFKLIAATEQDRRALKGLGTYGLIKGPTAFVLGAVGGGDKREEDFGYLMEQIVLFATNLDLGTCWLGGTFTKSSFAAQMALRDGELMPSVVSLGYIAGRRALVDRVIRRGSNGDRRLAWQYLFFDGQFAVPLTREMAGPYAAPLEMVRLGPSASNKQPWRILHKDGAWHFYLRRTPGYLGGATRRFVMADLQRVDMGIAMSHFELTAQELGLEGKWEIDQPRIQVPDTHTEYSVSWTPA